jgi:hypothetical protein
MRSNWAGVVGLLLLICGCSGRDKCPVDRVGFETLLARMTNLNAFAEAPLGPAFLESSYDRTGGNQDWVVYSRIPPNGRIKIFEVEGPGYISRFWIASFAADRWLFFFDGESEPRLNLSKDELFGEKLPFAPPLAGQSGGGRYCLLPIPFSKSIRIEMIPKDLKLTDRNYFHINYTRLNLKPESVESFPAELSPAQSNQVVAVNAAWTVQSKEQAALVKQCLKDVESKTIQPGESLTFWDDAGEGLLKTFCIRIDSPADSEMIGAELLRSLRLKMTWDGKSFPSVDVPLGDFFCNPFYLRSYSSMPLGRVDGAFICRFPMPYRKGARCVLENNSKIQVSVSVGVQGNRDSTEGLHRKFHAGWRASSTSGIPFRMLRTEGSGHYVGCFLSAIGQDGSWNILEGDECLKPDLGEQPPQLGTGLEDYFNGAYYYTSLFDLPLHGLIEKGAMRTDQYRFHLLDAVPFNKSFEAEIEFGDRNLASGYMSSVAFWYADRATSAILSPGQESLLARPDDRFELPGVMAQLFLLEREGLYVDAAARTDFFAQRYRTQPWGDIFKVRALACREKTAGFSAVKADYEALTNSATPAAAQAARDRLWMNENPSHALLGIHALGKYRLLQDGQPVADGEGRNDLRVLRVLAPPGEHTWTAELTPTHQGSFFSLCLRTQTGDVTSAGDWDILDCTEVPGRPHFEKFEGREVLPNMTVWAFEPNAYVDMQSPAMGIGLWWFWDSRPLVQRVRLNKKWVLEGSPSATLPQNRRERTTEELRAHAID